MRRNTAPDDIARSSGFTRVDLVATLAALAILCGLTLPVFGQSRMTSAGISCGSSIQQLIRGWLLYTADSGDRLVRSGGLDSLINQVSPTGIYPLNQWCMGTVDSGPFATNGALIQDSLLFPYVRSLPAYRCPADRSTYPNSGTGPRMDRVRSMSINGFMNPFNSWSSDNPLSSRPTKNFRRIEDIVTPDKTWVFVDENPISINDGWFICDPVSSAWIDIPSSLHQNAGNLGFADGHVELKRWNDPIILGPSPTFGVPLRDRGADLKWLQSRTTYGVAGFKELQ